MVKSSHENRVNMDKKWLFPLLVSLTCLILLSTSFNLNRLSSMGTINSFFSNSGTHKKYANLESVNKNATVSSQPKLPRLAYLISGSKGDLENLWRTLYALYHPWNLYVVHLELSSLVEERLELASRVANNSMFSKIGNVHVITRANMVTYRGPTMLANTLNACGILLKRGGDWDWFINLSASDYPLMTQDDILHTFSTLDRNLNFIEHTSRLSWKLEKRAKPLIVDPGLYSVSKSDIYSVVPRRSLPTAFKLFTGSAWTALSRPFVEYVILGWDNLPRILLMYYTNFISSPEGYFQTVVCNAPEFKRTVVNHDLHFISWDNPPKQHPHILTRNDTGKMVASGAPFARKFKPRTYVLDIIDRDFLHREKGSFTPGGWCSGNPNCSEVGNLTKLKPGPGAKRLCHLVDRAVLSAKLRRNQCR